MAQWYYTSNGGQQGPVDEQQLRQMIAAGQVAGTELAWREGMANWTPISSIDELRPPAGPVGGGSAGGYAPASPYSPGQPQQPVGYPPPGAYGNPYAQPNMPAAPGAYGQPQIGYGGYAPTGYSGAPVKVDNNMVWAILSTLFCCQITGIIAIVYAAQVEGKAARGDVAGARAAASTAMTWVWVGFGGWILIIVFWFFAVIAAG